MHLKIPLNRRDLDFIDFFAVASKLDVQHKNKSSPSDCFFVFGTMFALAGKYHSLQSVKLVV